MDNKSPLILIIYVLIMAVTTYLIRMLPMILCKKQIKNVFIKQFLFYMPYAVLAAMTFPAMFYATNNTVSAICGAIVAIICAYFERSLIFVASASCLSVFVTELILQWLNIL
ncbi:MAG: AzlD domain-containing protein [Oscillospiraceae bacterium]